MNEFLQSFSVILVETVCCVVFFEIFVGNNKRSKGILASEFIIILFLSFFSSAETYLLQKYEYIRQIVDAGITALILSLYFRVRFGKAFILAVVFMGLLWVADFIVILIYPALLQQTMEESGMKSYLVVILGKMFLFLIILVMNNIFRYDEVKYIKEKDWLAFLIMPFFSIAITSAFIKNTQVVMGTKLESLFVGLAFGMVCMNIVMFYFIQNIGKREYLLREKALLSMETRNKLQLYETISEKVQNQRDVSHEYKNQLTCIQSLCEKEEYDKLKEYLIQINGDILHDLDYIDTNNAFVNSVINAKYQEAVKKGILVVCKVNDLSGLTMNSSDVVVLFSNLLNNAIEACEKCTKKRNLKLKCVYEDDELILSIKNTYDGKLNKVGEKLYTTKTEERESHGIGLKNVIHIIEKSGGYYAIENTEDEFLISIVIPQ